MNTKILKKLSEKIRIKELDDQYILERKSEKYNDWLELSRSPNLEKLLIRKHNDWLAELHRLNLSGRLLARRKKYKTIKK